MTDKLLSQAAMRARAIDRFDCFIECVEDGREPSDVLNLLKVRVRAAREKAPLGKSSAIWSPLPAVRPGRVVVADKRSMHMQFTTSSIRSAAGVDQYVTGAREGPTADLVSEHLLDTGRPETAATAIDTYATHDRTAPGDRPDEQVITNMPSMSKDRASIWHQIELHESSQHKAGLDRINVQREKAPEFWAHIVSHQDCPSDFRHFLRCTGRHRDAGKRLDKRRAKIGTPYITADAAPDYRWLRAEFAKFAPGNVRDTPFKFSTARQPVSERHGDIELPAELNSAAHRRVAEKLRDKIAAYPTAAERRISLEDGTEAEGQLPVVIAYHPPEAGNDKRNSHLHFLFYDRAIHVEADGKVHFARLKTSALTSFGMMNRFRTDAQDIINDELAAAGEKIRVTTASLADLGSDATPQLKLGKGLSRIEAAGDLTDNGLHNRAESWRRLHRINTEYVADRQRDFDADDVVLRRSISEIVGVTPDERQQLDNARRELGRLDKAALEAEADARYASYVIDMAESSLKDAAEKALRQRDLASTQKQKAKWADETNALQAAHRDLLEELRPEIATRDHARRQSAQAAAKAEAAVVALIDTFDSFVLREQKQQVTRMAATLRKAETLAPRLTELHRLVDKIDSTPVIITSTNGRWHITAADDPAGTYAKVDLSMPEIQHRLQHVAEKHEKERHIAAAWLRKHGAAASQEDVLAGASSYVRKQLVRWERHLAERERVETSQSASATILKQARGTKGLDYQRLVPADGIQILNATIKKLRGPNAPVPLPPSHLADIALSGLNKSVNDAIRRAMTLLGATNRPPAESIDREKPRSEGAKTANEVQDADPLPNTAKRPSSNPSDERGSMQAAIAGIGTRSAGDR